MVCLLYSLEMRYIKSNRTRIAPQHEHNLSHDLITAQPVA